MSQIICAIGEQFRFELITSFARNPVGQKGFELQMKIVEKMHLHRQRKVH